MKRSTVIILCVTFVVVLVGVAIIFPMLSEKYTDENDDAASVDISDVSSATDFTVYNEGGKAINLSDKKGKPVVVNFWASWCVYCVKELPDFENLYREYKDRVDFMMVDLPDDRRETKSAALKFIEQNGYSFPVYFDMNGEAANAYVESGIPVTVFIDKSGNLYYKNVGMMHESTIREYLDAMLGE